MFATSLSYSFVLRDPLRLTTGTAMAMMIGLLYKRPDIAETMSRDQSQKIAYDDEKFREPNLQ